MPRTPRYELWMYERGLRQGWDIPTVPRAEAIDVLRRIASDDAVHWRDRKVAALALLRASRAELDAIATEEAVPYEELVDRLGALAEKDEVVGEPAEDSAWYKPAIYPTAPSLRSRESRRKRQVRSEPASVPAPSDNCR